jgi:tetratricopeptide (TPR) repeat protein
MHFVTMTGRNDPCPCGSGKKYKRCCLDADRAANAAADDQAVDHELDRLSNSVLDLVRRKRFKRALEICQRLLDEYPDVDDGLERSAHVHAAMGDHARAADFYRRAFAFASAPSRRIDYDPEAIEWYREQAEAEEKLAASR